MLTHGIVHRMEQTGVASLARHVHRDNQLGIGITRKLNVHGRTRAIVTHLHATRLRIGRRGARLTAFGSTVAIVVAVLNVLQFFEGSFDPLFSFASGPLLRQHVDARCLRLFLPSACCRSFAMCSSAFFKACCSDAAR